FGYRSERSEAHGDAGEDPRPVRIPPRARAGRRDPLLRVQVDHAFPLHPISPPDRLAVHQNGTSGWHPENYRQTRRRDARRDQTKPAKTTAIRREITEAEVGAGFSRRGRRQPPLHAAADFRSSGYPAFRHASNPPSSA